MPQFDAVVLYMMDVSGSMTDEQKEIVRIEAFWIDTWLKSQYDGVTTRYIIHDAVAREVDEHTFYHTRESGGTQDQLGLQAGQQDHRRVRIPPITGTSTSSTSPTATTGATITALHQPLARPAPAQVNLFGYGQVESPYGSGEFYRELEEAFDEIPNLALSEIRNKEGIYDSIKEFLGRGR